MADSPPRVSSASSMARRDALRVAMVIQRFRPVFSGQGEQVELLCRVLARRGVEPTVITSAYGQASSTEDCDGYRVVRLKAAPPRWAATAGVPRAHGPIFGARTMTYLLRHGGFDVVHVHALTDALYTSWLWCRVRRRPLVFEMTLVGADDPMTMRTTGQHLAGFRRAVFERCDGYVAISPALAEKYREAGLPAEKLRVLPQGVDVDQFRPADDRMALRGTLALPQAGPLLMFIGSLIRRKGIDLLLAAFERVHAARPDAHLVLIGLNRFDHDPNAAEFLGACRASLNRAAAAHVHELGLRQDVHRLLPAADVFVFPSRREGFGTVMIEAMASGVPCVVADQPGITDFIFDSDGASGTVVPQEDQEAVAGAVLSLLSDSARLEAVRREARQRAVEQFDIERIANRYLEFYGDLVAETRG